MGQKKIDKSQKTPKEAVPPFNAQGTTAQPTVWTVIGFLLSAVLLTLSWEPFGLWPLAWIGWVPFMLVCNDRLSTKRLLITAYSVALVYWLWNLHWLYLVTFPGYICFSLVFAGYWPVLAYCARFVRRKRWPLAVFAPLLFVGAEAVQGYLFTGFNWYFLAHSQWSNLPLIQICDMVGALGVSVLVAMANGVIADWLLLTASGSRRRGLFGRFPSPRRCLPCLVYTLLFLSLIGGALWYGRVRLSQTPAYVTQGPLIGAVQSNVPSLVKEETENAQRILDDLIADGNACVAAGAKLVVWPETMVLAAMNPEFRYGGFVGSPQAQEFDRQISDFCRGRCYVLFGANAFEFGNVDGRYGLTGQFNSAYYYGPDGQMSLQRYDKIHLVPFGEYIPFKQSAPWIYKAILFLSPYDYDYNLTPGTEHTVFDMQVNDKTYRFGALICYEDTDPTIARRHVLDKHGNKRDDWLVNISNDGWYVRFRNKQVIPMAELPQRTAISVFRSVENRISIIRSVNTGISCLIDSTGAIRNDFRAGTLPEPVMARQGVGGWFVDSVPIDSRVTLFSRYGRWLDIALGVFFVFIFGFSVYGSRKHPPKTEG